MFSRNVFSGNRCSRGIPYSGNWRCREIIVSGNRLKLYLIWFENLTWNSAKNTYGSVQVEINIIGENGEVYSEDIDDDDDYDYDDDIENMLRSCRYDPKLQQIMHVEGGSCTIPVPSLDQMRSVSQSPGAEQGQVPRPSQREDCPETCDCGNSPEWADCSHASNSQRCKFQTPKFCHQFCHQFSKKMF